MGDKRGASSAIIKRRITVADMVGPPTIPGVLPQFLLPRVTLRSWGFDSDGEFVWWDDPCTGDRLIQQQEGSDPYPHGRCQCGGAYDEQGVCEDKCARESYDHDR